MPIRLNPASGSNSPNSATTRPMMRPTVRHEIRMYSQTADFEQFVASHATDSSKALVNPDLWRAHGTAATTTPCFRQATRGASPSSQVMTVPRSSPLHLRRLPAS